MATRVQWLGHSCLWIETDGLKLLVDPFLSGNPKAAADPDKLNPDYIFVSHGHGDHVGGHEYQTQAGASIPGGPQSDDELSRGAWSRQR